jgi:hypothetical protein
MRLVSLFWQFRPNWVNNFGKRVWWVFANVGIQHITYRSSSPMFINAQLQQLHNRTTAMFQQQLLALRTFLYGVTLLILFNVGRSIFLMLYWSEPSDGIILHLATLAHAVLRIRCLRHFIIHNYV